MLNKIREEMKRNNIEVVFLNSYENNKVGMNIFYATNFTGSSSSILISHEFAYFLTDFRYQSTLDNLRDGYEVVIQKPGQSMFDAVKILLEKHGINKVSIDPNMYYSEIVALESKYGLTINSFGNIFDECRNIKTADELVKMRKACEITDKAYSYLLEIAKPGMSELELTSLLERKMVDLGAESPSFETILVSGVSGALPHGKPSEKVLEEGELVTVDFGCYFEKYASDMTRTFAVGKVSEELEKIYNIVLEAQLAGVAAVKSGALASEVDYAARKIITDAGYGQYFGHGLGHGLGIDVHESIRLSDKSEQVLKVGNVVTIEPGIYIPGLGGVRIEDDVIVTEDGCEILNKSDKTLLSI
ncbi:MAG: M24 family metallopeptidase [Bacilli bacterium]